MAVEAQLLATVRGELAAVAEAIRGHRYLDAAEQGTVPVESLRAFAAEQRLVIASDRRSFAQLAARFPADPAGEFFLDMAKGEGLALGHLDALAGALGPGAAFEPRPGCQAYPAFVAWLALNGGRADVALAFAANLAAWGEACGRLAAALRSRYGLDGAAVAFFDHFAATPPGFEERCLAVAAQGLAAGEDAAQARRAARLLQAYELLWWETVAEDL